MFSLTNFFLISLICSVFGAPLHEEWSNKKTATSNILRQQLLKDPTEDNSSHHALEETNIPQIVEKIRSVDLFKAKVSKRINSSSVILHFPGMKTKLLETAVEKFKLCEIARSTSSETTQEMDHSCLGIATAQMMSLIHAFEKNPSMHF
ncbi:uncharacterized protein LOC129941751 [Eupeodes corollae]|uniref:uncharacterized protein LOC129941751 n=1 Tax=Eupeodes corollae TaxID=290404 RepID=UPI0024909139|nr:uncharacterized protein LOC129941751 [Eupeodes corollae]